MIFLLFCLIYLSHGTKLAHAQIIISEVFPAPSEGAEWIELYNQSADQTLDLANWSLQDQLTTPSLIYTFNDETILAPASYLTIELAQPKLNNSADGVTLFNDQQTIIDQISYDSSQTDLSWSRTSADSFILSTPSKNSPNPAPPSPSPSPSSTPTPTPTPSPSPSPSPTLNPTPTPNPPAFNHSLIKIDSFVACPDKDETESVTLLNTDSVSHQLIDWRLRDASGQTRKIDLTLPAQGTGTISWGNSLLNNDGDTLYLEDETGQIIQNLSYENCSDEVAETTNSNTNDNQSNTNGDSTKTDTDHSPTDSQQSLLTPPPKPKPPYKLDKIALTSTVNSSASPSSHLTTIPPTPQPPLLALSSAILGGCLLVVRHGLPLLLDISQHFSGRA